MGRVPYEGKWLVRIGSTKREMTKDKFGEFNRKGEIRKAIHEKITKITEMTRQIIA